MAHYSAGMKVSSMNPDACGFWPPFATTVPLPSAAFRVDSAAWWPLTQDVALAWVTFHDRITPATPTLALWPGIACRQRPQPTA